MSQERIIDFTPKTSFVISFSSANGNADSEMCQGGVFETTGARATAGKVGLDRYWRDVRTHTLHDPVSYKETELGRYVLLGEVPEPTWYT